MDDPSSFFDLAGTLRKQREGNQDAKGIVAPIRDRWGGFTTGQPGGELGAQIGKGKQVDLQTSGHKVDQPLGLRRVGPTGDLLGVNRDGFDKGIAGAARGPIGFVLYRIGEPRLAVGEEAVNSHLLLGARRRLNVATRRKMAIQSRLGPFALGQLFDHLVHTVYPALFCVPVLGGQDDMMTG